MRMRHVVSLVDSPNRGQENHGLRFLDLCSGRSSLFRQKSMFRSRLPYLWHNFQSLVWRAIFLHNAGGYITYTYLLNVYTDVLLIFTSASGQLLFTFLLYSKKIIYELSAIGLWLPAPEFMTSRYPRLRWFIQFCPSYPFKLIVSSSLIFNNWI